VLKQRVVIDAEAMIESPFRSSNSNPEHSGFQATSASIFMERSALSSKEIPWQLRAGASYSSFAKMLTGRAPQLRPKQGEEND
jgi:hypothetical protein